MRNVELLSKNKDMTKQIEAVNKAIEKFGHKDNETMQIDSVDNVVENDVVFIYDYSCLGKSFHAFIEAFKVLVWKRVEVHFVVENMNYWNDVQLQGSLTSLTFAEECERRLRSAVSKENLAEAATRGKFAGRPKGTKNKESLIITKAAEIEFWLQQGETKKWIAKQLGISVGTIYNYIKSKTEA